MKSKKEIISNDFLQSLGLFVTIFGGIAGGLAFVGLHPYLCFAIFIVPTLYIIILHVVEKKREKKISAKPIQYGDYKIGALVTDKPSFEEPEGTVPLNSPFYVERPPIESESNETIIRDGALIRIKAPRQMGKTSLLTRILHHAKQQKYRTAYVSFQEGDEKVFADLDQLLRWFCTSITTELKLPNKLDDYWQNKYEGALLHKKRKK